MKYEGKNRYQYQNRVVKCYRWLRWMPIGYIKAIFRLVLWVLGGAQPMDWFNRHETAKTILMSYRSIANFRMGHYYHLDEVIGENDD